MRLSRPSKIYFGLCAVVVIVLALLVLEPSYHPASAMGEPLILGRGFDTIKEKHPWLTSLQIVLSDSMRHNGSVSQPEPFNVHLDHLPEGTYTVSILGSVTTYEKMDSLMHDSVLHARLFQLWSQELKFNQRVARKMNYFLEQGRRDSFWYYYGAYESSSQALWDIFKQSR